MERAALGSAAAGSLGRAELVSVSESLPSAQLEGEEEGGGEEGRRGVSLRSCRWYLVHCGTHVITEVDHTLQPHWYPPINVPAVKTIRVELLR